MNDNTILFLATFAQRLIEQVNVLTAQHSGGNIEEQKTYIEEMLKRIIVPLQGAKTTNYIKMEQDLFKLQYTTVSKYEKVKRLERGKAAEKQGNPDGARVLSCITEAIKLFVLPVAQQHVKQQKEKKITGIQAEKMQIPLFITKKFIEFANTDLITHK
eukprot:UN02837